MSSTTPTKGGSVLDFDDEFAETFRNLVQCALIGHRPFARTEFGHQNGPVFDSAGKTELKELGELEADVEWFRAKELERFIRQRAQPKFNADLKRLEVEDASRLYLEFVVWHRTNSVILFLEDLKEGILKNRTSLHVLDLEPGLGIFWIRQPVGLARIVHEFLTESLEHAGLSMESFLGLKFEQQFELVRRYQGRFTYFAHPLVRNIPRCDWGDPPNPIPA